MEKLVEIKRSYADCKMCMDMADMYNQIPDCELCKNPRGTWVDTIRNIFSTRAVVILEDGEVGTFPLDRLKVITKRDK